MYYTLKKIKHLVIKRELKGRESAIQLVSQFANTQDKMTDER